MKKVVERNLLMNKVVKGNDSTIWAECTTFVRKYNGLNMSVGARDMLPPPFLLSNLMEAVKTSGNNQYSHPAGHPALREAISGYYNPIFGRKLDTEREITVTSGARMSLAGSVFGHLDAGDEILVLEPLFPFIASYADMIDIKHVGVPLKMVSSPKGDTFHLDLDALENAITPKSRLLFLNNPHNPTGKVFTQEEYIGLSKLLDKYPRIIVLADQVYSHVTFEGNEFINFANIGDNWKKTISVFSGGKLFDATGWMVGWAIGPSDLIFPIKEFHVMMCFVPNVPSQVAMASSMPELLKIYGEAPTFGKSVSATMEKNHDLLISFLEARPDLGLKPIKAEGGFFILLNCVEMSKKIDRKYYKNEFMEEIDHEPKIIFPGEVPLDYAVYRFLAYEQGVVCIPGSIFYHSQSLNITNDYLRISLCVATDIMELAIQKLNQIKL